VGDVLALEQDLSLTHLAQARDRLERGGLARTVGADEGRDGTLLDTEGDVADGLDVPVVDAQALYLKRS
jgi:hypothetical protein